MEFLNRVTTLMGIIQLGFGQVDIIVIIGGFDIELGRFVMEKILGTIDENKGTKKSRKEMNPILTWAKRCCNLWLN